MLQCVTNKWGCGPGSVAPKKNVHDLHHAICHGNESDVTAVINSNVLNVNATVCGATALSLTLYREKTNLFNIILAHYHGNGLDINKNSKDDKNRLEPPLVTAVRLGNWDVVRILIQNGVELEGVDSFNHTALWMATRQRHTEMVKILLIAGASVNPSLQWSFSPLFYAVKHSSKRAEIAKLLLSHGADVRIDIKNGPSLLYSAIIQGNIVTAKLLVEAGYNPTKDDKLRAELMSGTLTRYSDLIGWLTNEMCNPSYLLQQCRTVIRRTICDVGNGKYFARRINLLPLPSSVVKYIALENVISLID